MPFQIPSIRIAQASPSISLEKGSYRLRAPPARLSPSPSSSRPSSSSSLASTRPASSDGTAREPMPRVRFVPASYEKRMALLVALLGCAMLLSFGTAYWLWTTGQRHRP